MMWTEVIDILLRLVAAGLLGACIGFERRMQHKAIGIAGMVLIAVGSTIRRGAHPQEPKGGRNDGRNLAAEGSSERRHGF